MGPKTKISSGPGAGSIIANWKNKDYSKIPLEELLIAIENGATEMIKRQNKFEMGLSTLEALGMGPFRA
jgi:hypothetical protein